MINTTRTERYFLHIVGQLSALFQLTQRLELHQRNCMTISQSKDISYYVTIYSQTLNIQSPGHLD